MTETVANKGCHAVSITLLVYILLVNITPCLFTRSTAYIFKDDVFEIWKVFFLFLLLCCQAISPRRRNGEWDSPWAIPRFTLARSNFAVLNYELITWPWSCPGEGAAPINSWQNVIFVSRGPDVNVPLQQPAKWSELSRSDSAHDCRCWQTLQMCCSLKNASPAPLRRLGHLLPAKKAPSVTVPAHQGVGSTLTSTKWVISGLAPVLGVFAWV